MLPAQVLQQGSAGQRGCSPTLLSTGPFSPTTSNTLREEICFQLPSADTALLSRSEPSWSLGHHRGGDVPLPCIRGWSHEAWRRRHPAQIRRRRSPLPNFRHLLGFYRDLLGSSCSSASKTRWHPSSPSTAAWARVSRPTAMSREPPSPRSPPAPT